MQFIEILAAYRGFRVASLALCCGFVGAIPWLSTRFVGALRSHWVALGGVWFLVWLLPSKLSPARSARVSGECPVRLPFGRLGSHPPEGGYSVPKQDSGAEKIEGSVQRRIAGIANAASTHQEQRAEPDYRRRAIPGFRVRFGHFPHGGGPGLLPIKTHEFTAAQLHLHSPPQVLATFLQPCELFLGALAQSAKNPHPPQRFPVRFWRLAAV
jgi:hypothetical protein